jgi:hypothetical protein
MALRLLSKTKNRYTTWVLALVLFFSGLSFSGSICYAKEGQVKARTELIVSVKVNLRRATSLRRAPSLKSFAPLHSQWLSDACSFLKFYGRTSETQLIEVNKTYRNFFLDLLRISFSHRQTVSALSYLIV